jgi:hypothetical protein
MVGAGVYKWPSGVEYSCSSNEFSQFFVAHSSVHVRDRRSGHDRLQVLKDTPIVYKLRPAGCPYPPVACHLLQRFSQTWTFLRPSTCNSFSSPVRNPNSYAMASSPCLSPWDAKFFHLTCLQQRPPCSLMPQSRQHIPPLRCTVHRYRWLLTTRSRWPDTSIGV